MKRYILLLFIIPLWVNAQLTDSFTDGDFTSNPTWTGTTEKYIVNEAKQLQLAAAEAGKTWLSTPYTLSGSNTEWRFWIKLAFAPSGSNYSEVFLSSDKASLEGDLNGYVLRFGEAGSNDAIELFLKQGSTMTSVCRGTNALLASSFALFVKVIRKANGDWSIFIDPSGSGIYTLDASGNNNVLTPGGHFGFSGTFTVSNSTKMYYDDVFVGAEVLDTNPPEVLSVVATDLSTVEVTFNEAIETQSLTQTANYTINHGIGSPLQVIQGTTAAQAVLNLANPLENGKIYQLTLSDLKDISGNIMPTITKALSYYQAGSNDIVINEVMADPSPVVGLPEWEFVELHNTTGTLINLNDFVFVIGTTEKPMTNIQIEPNGFLILAHEDARAALSPLGSFYGFSSFQLANSGAKLTLKNSTGLVISAVNYTDTWYRNSAKADGGWTLEQIDPTNPCGGAFNWTASNDLSGGTPGRQNSVFAISNTSPKLSLIKLVSNQVVQLWFDQQMDRFGLGNAANYRLEPGNIQPSSVATNIADPAFVELSFETAFSQGVLYELHIYPTLMNCAGRPVGDGVFIAFGLPETIEKNDVVINEVLFNPLNNGVDFVEIYNRSNKILNLENLRLGDVRQTFPNPPDTTLKVITTTTRLLMPEGYALLTTNIGAVTEIYSVESTDNFVSMASFPSYPNEKGTVLLKSDAGVLVDLMSYNEKMHYPLLNTVDGVSLERISVDRPSLESENWHSAAQSVGFATPGFRNSVQVNDYLVEDELLIDPETFSPDGDGYYDVTTLRYSFAQAGNNLNIYIYSASGQLVRHLVKSNLVAETGAVSWDGLDDNGNKVPTGIYVVYAEVFALDGKVRGIKKAVVVATR